ncbi:MAG TPA: adenine nucleotide alpha hydrolase family protein [Thermoplasmatales archaeon]|nr:adenine nucleotide alpha hydrolase family protein [Thermoplasmatales archaeon]
MKCRVCGKKAEVHLHYLKMHLCREHFTAYFERKVERTIKKHRMLTPDDRTLVAVSGGKDSAALIYLLKKLGYGIGCLHINLGIGEYSKKSEEYVRKQCGLVDVQLNVVDLKKNLGKSVDEVKGSRPTCSVCGTTKRYILNRFAYENGFNVVATGHNLDDESAFVFSNIMNWSTEYLGKQGPVLSGEGKFVKRIKPFYEVTEQEITDYALSIGIEYLTGRCPLSKGATVPRYKHVLDEMEKKRRGTKINFIKGFLRKKHLFEAEISMFSPKECKVCSMPAQGERCAFCKIWGLEEATSFLTATL